MDVVAEHCPDSHWHAAAEPAHMPLRQVSVA
jgi:hypothetical protein